jgi:hypothetical protein
MTDEITDTALDDRLRAADPLDPSSLPTEAETDAALRQLLAQRPAPAHGWLTFRRPHTRVLVSATAATAAVCAGLLLALSATTSPPAFAVTRNANGSVTVQLAKLSGIAGANHRLAALGIRARIITEVRLARELRLVHPCSPLPPTAARALTFYPGTVPPRAVLLLGANRLAQLGLVVAPNALRARPRALARFLARRLRAAPPPFPARKLPAPRLPTLPGAKLAPTAVAVSPSLPVPVLAGHHPLLHALILAGGVPGKPPALPMPPGFRPVSPILVFCGPPGPG